jgi:hypothetical protein
VEYKAKPDPLAKLGMKVVEVLEELPDFSVQQVLLVQLEPLDLEVIQVQPESDMTDRLGQQRLSLQLGPLGPPDLLVLLVGQE